MQPSLFCKVINISATSKVRLDGAHTACIHGSYLDGYSCWEQTQALIISGPVCKDHTFEVWFPKPSRVWSQ